MKPFIRVAIALALAACSGGGGSTSSPAHEPDAGHARANASPDGGHAASVAVADGGANAAPAGAVAYAGTMRGETDVPDGGIPDGGTAWRGQGTLHLAVSGEEVTGKVEAEGMNLEVRGNIAAGALRAWLRAPAGQPRTEGVLIGNLQGQRLTGTWRASGPGGAEVRAGSFEASH